MDSSFLDASNGPHDDLKIAPELITVRSWRCGWIGVEKDARDPGARPRQGIVPTATALPVTKGAADAFSVAQATPAAERAIEPDSREIVAAGGS